KAAGVQRREIWRKALLLRGSLATLSSLSLAVRKFMKIALPILCLAFPLAVACSDKRDEELPSGTGGVIPATGGQSGVGASGGSLPGSGGSEHSGGSGGMNPNGGTGNSSASGGSGNASSVGGANSTGGAASGGSGGGAGGGGGTNNTGGS